MKANRYIFSIFVLFITLNLRGQYRYSYLQLGKNELRVENYTEAIIYFNKSIEILPQQYEGYYLRGIAKYYLDDKVGAETDFGRAISKLPLYPRLYLLRGLMRSEMLKTRDALEDFNTGIALDSTLSDLYYYRAVTFANVHEYQNALFDCEKVIAIDSLFPNIHLFRGVVLVRLSRCEEAIAEFNREIKENPGFSSAIIERGNAYLELENFDRAITDFNSVLAKDSLNGYALYQRALAKMKLLEYESALKDFNRVIELSPDNQLAIFSRALAQSSTHADKEAQADLFRIIDQNPQNMMVFYNLGLTQTRMKDYKGAIKSFSAAIALFPDYADAYIARGQAYMALGDKSAGMRDIQTGQGIEIKNQVKADSVKYQEGLTILQLTRLESDFSSEEEKKGKIQYQPSEIKLKPVFWLSFSPEINQNMQAYDCRKIDFYRMGNLSLIAAEADSLKEDELYPSIEDTLVTFDTTRIVPLLIKGMLLLQESNFESAIANFDKLLEIFPNNIPAWFCRANVRLAMLQDFLQSKGNTNDLTIIEREWVTNLFLQIRNDFERIESLDPGFYFATYNKGYARFLVEDYLGATENFESVILRSNMPAAYFNKGLLLILMGQKNNGCHDMSQAGELGIKDAYPVIKKYCQ